MHDMKENLEHLQQYLNLKCKYVQYVTLNGGGLETGVAPSYLTKFMNFLRDDLRCEFTQLADITAVDNMPSHHRFTVVYNLLSLSLNQRLTVKVEISAEDEVPSMTAVFPNAGWYEREVYDMFGIRFKGHPDLRRLLTDDGFSGHPLRKDYPVRGEVELYYDAKKGKCEYRRVSDDG